MAATVSANAGTVQPEPRPVGALTARPGRTLRRDRFPAPLHLGRSLLGYRLLPLGRQARLGLARSRWRDSDLDDPALDEQTFASWLAQHGQGEAAVSALWDLICLPTVNLPAREASLSMAAKVFQTGLLTDSGAGESGGAGCRSALLHGERAASALSKAGVQIRLGESVKWCHRQSPSGPGGRQLRPSVRGPCRQRENRCRRGRRGSPPLLHRRGPA